MKKHLITGLIILLPLALTVLVVRFVFNLLTEPFAGFVTNGLNSLGLFQTGFLFLTAEETQQVASKIIILIFLFVLTLILGILARWYLIKAFLKFWDFILHRIPFVKNIYRVSQDVINTIFSNNSNSFKQVVMVPFPHQNSYSIGLISRDDLPPLRVNGPPLISVFVPTTPNPTSGFLIAVEEKDVMYLDMKVEEAFKCIVSCGVIQSPIKFITKKEAMALSESHPNDKDLEKIIDK